MLVNVEFNLKKVKIDNENVSFGFEIKAIIYLSVFYPTQRVGGVRWTGLENNFHTEE